jgi:hypothetical protein
MKTLLALAVVLALGGSASAASDGVKRLIVDQTFETVIEAEANCNLTPSQEAKIRAKADEVYTRFPGTLPPIGAASEKTEYVFVNQPVLRAVRDGELCEANDPARAADFDLKWFGEHAAQSDQFPTKWQGSWCQVTQQEYHRGACNEVAARRNGSAYPAVTKLRDNTLEAWEVKCTLIEGSYDKQREVFEALWLCGFTTAWAYRAEYHSPKKGVLIEHVIGSTEQTQGEDAETPEQVQEMKRLNNPPK